VVYRVNSSMVGGVQRPSRRLSTSSARLRLTWDKPPAEHIAKDGAFIVQQGSTAPKPTAAPSQPTWSTSRRREICHHPPDAGAGSAVRETAGRWPALTRLWNIFKERACLGSGNPGPGLARC
jgi:hypothetical protein